MDLGESLGEPVRGPQIHREEEDVPDEGEPRREECPADQGHDKLGPLRAGKGPRVLERRNEARRGVADDPKPDEPEGGNQDAREVGSEAS